MDNETKFLFNYVYELKNKIYEIESKIIQIEYNNNNGINIPENKEIDIYKMLKGLYYDILKRELNELNNKISNLNI